MPLRVLRLLPLPTVCEHTWPNNHSFASTLQIAAGRAWTRRLTAHAPSQSARKRPIQTDVDTQVASSSSQTGDSASSASNRHLRKSKSPVPRSKPSPTTHVEHLTADANLRTSSFNWRDRLQEKHPILEPEVKIPPVTSRKARRNRKKAQGTFVADNNLTLDPPEPPDTETTPFIDDNIDLFNEISPESKTELLSVVSDSLPTPGLQLLVNPTSRASLYHNILYLVNVRKPSAPLPSLVDYHNRYPAWQSTRSYNYLIDLSIRHRQHGITQNLFRSINRNGLSMNIESHKLMVRCLIQQDMWDEAWDYVWTLIKRQSLPRDAMGREAIPFTIWLELCRTPRRFRKTFDRGRTPTTREEQYQLLHSITPGNIPSLRKTSPFAIFCFVDLMLRTGRQQAALSVSKEYFKALPRFLNNKLLMGCLRIIHSHMAHNTAKPGLSRFFDVRRTLISFLQLHPSLKPNGKTLCLLFQTLQRAKKCGSIAWKQLSKFKKDWGPQVENRRVLRKVSQLALKEGRLDITKKIHFLDFESRILRRRQLREESLVVRLDLKAPGQRRRLPYRLIYPRNGKQARLWYRHRARIRFKLWLMSSKGRRNRSGAPVTLDPDFQ